MESGGGGAVPVGDGNDACTEAVSLTETSPGRWTSEASIPQGDRDYFSFQAEAGEWFQLTLIPSASQLDSVIRVWDESGQTLLATGEGVLPSSDEFASNSSSKVYFRASSAGSYCIESLNQGDWLDEDPGSGAFSPEVEVEVVPLSPSLTDLWNEDAEPNDDFPSAQTLTAQSASGRTTTYIAGVFEGPEDVDRYAFNLSEPAYLFVYPSPPGPGADGASGYGFTSTIGHLRIHDGAQSLVAEVEPRTLPLESRYCLFYACGPSWIYLDAGSYTLSVTRGDDAAGTNDAYHMFMSLWTDGIAGAFPAEGASGFTVFDDGSNDLVGGAQPTFNAASTSTFFGSLPEGDVDYWRVAGGQDPEPGATLEVDCRSAEIGSGVRGFRVTYVDGAGVAQERSATAQGGLGILWNDRESELGVSTGPALLSESNGPHLLRIENDATEADSPAGAKNYRCFVRRISP